MFNLQELIFVVRKKQKSLAKHQIISAQVVLRSASSKSFHNEHAITAKNIEDYIPSTETVNMVTKAFAKAGFEVSPVVSNSFAITATVRIFEKMFNTRLSFDKRSGITSVALDNSDDYELPLQSLPKAIVEYIEAVTFTPPPDFGPISFS